MDNMVPRVTTQRIVWCSQKSFVCVRGQAESSLIYSDSSWISSKINLDRLPYYLYLGLRPTELPQSNQILHASTFFLLLLKF